MAEENKKKKEEKKEERKEEREEEKKGEKEEKKEKNQKKNGKKKKKKTNPFDAAKNILATIGALALLGFWEEVLSILYFGVSGVLGGGYKSGKAFKEKVVDPALLRVATYFRVGFVGLVIALIIGVGAFVLHFGGLTGQPTFVMLLTLFFVVMFILWGTEQAASVIVPSLVSKREDRDSEFDFNKLLENAKGFLIFLGLIVAIAFVGLITKVVGLTGWWLSYTALAIVAISLFTAAVLVISKIFQLRIDLGRFFRNILISLLAVAFFAYFASFTTGALLQATSYLLFISVMLLIVSLFPLVWVGYWYYKVAFREGKYGHSYGQDRPTFRHYTKLFLIPVINFLLVCTGIVLYAQYFQAWTVGAALMVNIIIAIIAVKLAGYDRWSIRFLNNFVLILGIIFFLASGTITMFYKTAPSDWQALVDNGKNVVYAMANNKIEDKALRDRLPGDIDGNGERDDLPYLESYVNGQLPLAEEYAMWGDVNNDSLVNEADVTLYRFCNSIPNFSLLMRPQKRINAMLARKRVIVKAEIKKEEKKLTLIDTVWIDTHVQGWTETNILIPKKSTVKLFIPEEYRNQEFVWDVDIQGNFRKAKMAYGARFKPNQMAKRNRPGDYLLKNFPVVAPIGKIGDEKPFGIGPYTERNIRKEGYLFLAINERWVPEMGCWEDNKGMIPVVVEIYQS